MILIEAVPVFACPLLFDCNSTLKSVVNPTVLEN